MDNATKGFAQKIISELEKIVHALTHAPGQQDETAITPQQAASQENNPGRGQPTLRAHIEPSPRNTKQPENRWYKTLNGWKSVAELIAIPFAIGYAAVTYFQWRDVHRNFQIDQRAWLQVRIKTEAKDITDYFKPLGDGLLLEVINIGKTPATNVEVRTAGEILRTGSPPTLAYNSPGGITTGILFQGAPMPFPGGGYAAGVSEADRQSLIAGNSYIVVYGMATFQDIFKVPHWTRFCIWHGFVVGRIYQAKACTDYNSTDSN